MRQRTSGALIALAGLCLAGLVYAGTGPGPSSRIDLKSARAGLGGLSAVEVSADGTGLAMMSDRGTFVRGTLRREGGRITAVALGPDIPLTVGRGAHPDDIDDTEGLAIAADGTVFVSYEGRPRIVRFSRPDRPGEALTLPPQFAALQQNSGLEALAIGPDGSLYTLPERSGNVTRPFPLWKRDPNGRWSIVAQIPRHGGYLPVGSDIGPDGKFYLLERNFTFLGFKSRVRRFDLSAPGDGEVVLETDRLTHGNLEGLAVWRDASGAIRLVMVSDDNFNAALRSELVEYILAPDGPSR
ncbi:hypothetical protein ATO6_05650 [Oceanicola sp. 22II-s10i]|uniref:esterase-like activity of phytase family protein n=1 Tax=Oceanicola sp. 22II-s10i TaxID=1317116 RepID=UPI000B525669|nr:esterase-like activity of phytase family protein [Oceanicola sp. 22II-s10i]OWU86312.1 hypothetical protein ATO6_05650 [Oceanicola sp. 22II-s10i]